MPSTSARVRRLLAAVAALTVAVPVQAAAGQAPVEAAVSVADTPVGFAAVNALGQNGTTGGAAGPTVTVTNATDLAHFAGLNTPYTILVSGRITFDDMITVVANKSIIGVGATAEISGGGLQMGSTTRPGNNVIVRNLRFSNASDDSVSVTNSAHHVWIDHNDFSNGFDGLLDIKRQSDFVTVSWNLFHEHSKTALLGHSDTFTQDVGHLRVTYHHNFFDGTDQRHPRVRFGDPVHVYNNYYLNNSLYGVASTMNAGVLMEGNYFQNVAHPSFVGYEKSGPGRLVERNNIYQNSGAPQTAGTVTEPRTYYAYTLDNPADVPAIVRAGVGVGRVGTPAVAEAAAAAAASGAPDGFASVNALGQNGTTGGAGGAVVTVTTTDQLLRAIDTVGPLIIQVQGRIAIESKQGVRPNKTVIGLGGTAEITGGGLDFHRSFNVIVRNIRFTNAEDDSVNVGQNSHHIWIDHNEFSGALDGSVDIVRGAEYVTVSWNWFHGTDKTMLIGHSDGNAAEDTGHLKITIHHNFFDGSTQRHPRVRFGEPVHVYNNYFRANTLYGVASTMNAGVLVEGNYFESVAFPCYSASGYADSGPGRLVQRNNIFTGSGTCEVAGTVTEPRTFYPYTVDSPANVPALVRAGVGVGKV
jgi:pectate lyase